MKTVLNKTTRPLKIHLSRGKVLHLGPRKEGQIAHQDIERGSIQKMIEAGELEVVGEGPHATGSSRSSGSVHSDSRGHHPHTTVKKRGDR